MASGRSRPCVSEITPMIVVIPSKRSLRSEGSGRAARSGLFFATQESRVWLASLSRSPPPRFASLPPHLLNKLPNAHNSAADSAAADFLNIIACGHAQNIKPSVKRLERSLRLGVRPNAAGRPVLNVDRSSHRDLVSFAVGLQREKARSLHQADHVRRGINRRQFGVVRGQRVLELDGLLSLAARSDG